MANPGRKWALRVGLVLLVVGVVVFRLRFATTPVRWASVDRGGVTSEVLGTGTLEARIAATISPKISGRLAEVLVDEGDRVAAGQLLARLDDLEWRGQVAVAEAGLQAAMATVDRVRADEARAQAVLRLAQLSHDRAVGLREANVAAESDLDNAVEGLRVAEADVTRVQAAIVEAQRQRIAAEETHRFQQALLEETRLSSPFAGLVVRRDRDPGDVGVPGSSILRLINTNELWISAWVDETAMAGLAVGQSARVVFRSEPDRSHAGVVSRLGREADRETREFRVDVRVEELPVNWVLGQRAEVYIATGSREGVLRVPRPALTWVGRVPGVYRIEDGRLRWTPVEPGLTGAAQVELVGGISEGDKVAMGLVGKAGPLKDGMRVRLP